MRRRTATGWRRWALGAGSGLLLCVASGVGAAVAANAAALSGSATPSAAVLTSGNLLPSMTLLGPLSSSSLPVSTSGLPILGSTPSGCVPNVNCPTSDPGHDTGQQNNGRNHTASPSGISSSAPAPTASNLTPTGSRVGSRAPAQSSGGLNIGPPPSVLAIGPATSISFGKAPFLWPLFAALDAMGLVAVVMVVRKTWSRSAAD